MEKCHICFEKCIVPVQLNCFSCYKDIEINCNSLQRVCLLCFLENDLQKCSFCHAPRCNNNIKIDYTMMENDSLSKYSCPLCNDFSGSHFELYTHMVKSCMYLCECGKWVIKSREKEHIQGKCSHWKWCSACNKKVDKCIHFPCKDCGKVCRNKRECCGKRMQCPTCHDMIPCKQLMNHILVHVDDSKKKIEMMKYVLQKERKEYHKLMELVPNIYKDIYDETL